ncbi:MAG: hypothetical protein APF82_03870 [Sphingomonadales bacterium BRH_c42]|nr:MAG: hypothetical protein APF82_03870 [Sphingomonadales bacterium BRH_c42]
MHFELRGSARADLAGIWLVSANRWGVDQAEAYVRLIGERLAAICDFPRSYPVHQGRHEGFRKAATGEHVIFYWIQSDLIDVVRVLHNRMDFDELLE